MKESTYGPNYEAARAEAFARSGGRCQFCGLRPAEEAHHWAWRYPKPGELTANDLTALCGGCHVMATALRRHEKAGGNPHELATLFAEAVAKSEGGPLPLAGDSSRVAARPNSTSGLQPRKTRDLSEMADNSSRVAERSNFKPDSLPKSRWRTGKHQGEKKP